MAKADQNGKQGVKRGGDDDGEQDVDAEKSRPRKKGKDAVEVSDFRNFNRTPSTNYRTPHSIPTDSASTDSILPRSTQTLRSMIAV